MTNYLAAVDGSGDVTSLPALIDLLGPGDVGFLDEGLYPVNNYKISKSNITIRAVKGAKATIKGRLWVAGDFVTLERLTLNNINPQLLPSTITGDDVILRNNKITNDRSTIGFTIGSQGWGRAYRTLIEGNKIFNCGRLPATNYDHGLYVEASTFAVIRHNWIYENADRGIQLYPDAQDTLIEYNVIDRNGSGIIFGGDVSHASSNNIVRNNIITNSKMRDNVENYYDAGHPVGQNNLVTKNCIYGGAYDNGDGGILQNAKGFTAVDNIIADPLYKAPLKGNYNLTSQSPALEIMQGAKKPLKL